MDEFEALVDGLDGQEIEREVRGDRYLEATLNFWEATRAMADILRAQGLSFTEAYFKMEAKSDFPEWRNSKAEALFALAWALGE